MKILLTFYILLFATFSLIAKPVYKVRYGCTLTEEIEGEAKIMDDDHAYLYFRKKNSSLLQRVHPSTFLRIENQESHYRIDIKTDLESVY